MSLLNSFRTKQEELNRLQAEVEKLASSEELKNELEFRDSIQDVLDVYGKNIDDAIRAVDPNHPYLQGQPARRTRRPRATRRYTNPHTGEWFDTRGGNHKTLRAWKEQYGAKEVDGWSKVVS